MSTVLPDELLELRDENDRLRALLTRAVEGLEDEWHPWFAGGLLIDAVRDWVRDARQALGLNTEASQ